MNPVAEWKLASYNDSSWIDGAFNVEWGYYNTGWTRTAKGIGLTHLVVDDKSERPSFLRDVFLHEEKYPYLVKMFDSATLGYKHDVKIFKIDYSIFDKTTSR